MKTTITINVSQEEKKDDKNFYGQNMLDAFLSGDKKKQEEIRAEFDKFMSSKEGTLIF